MYYKVAMVGHGQGLRITSAIILVADQSINHNPAHEKSMQNMQTGLQKHQTSLLGTQTGLAAMHPWK